MLSVTQRRRLQIQWAAACRRQLLLHIKDLQASDVLLCVGRRHSTCTGLPQCMVQQRHLLLFTQVRVLHRTQLILERQHLLSKRVAVCLTSCEARCK